MMKNIFLILMLALISCQDDFCAEATTPNLVIRFYDKSTVDDTLKNINLVVNADNLDFLFDGTTAIDSLYVPIKTTENTVTYNLSILDSIGSEEQLTINYTIEDVYVSQACGYKSIFRNFTLSSTQNNWIGDIVQVKTEIINDEQAHIKIYH